MHDAIFSQMDFGPLNEFLEDDDITDISYSNGGQVWLKTLTKGVYQVERPDINDAFMEKLAFQCSNVMGVTFNMAHPFLDAESAELRMNFIHDSIATNGIACVVRKTPAKIRLNKDKLLSEKYVTEDLHDFLIKCVEGHCNIIVSGETGSGKTELVKYLASHTKENEKIITIEDTLELHLDKIFPHRDIVAMKTNNIASYSDVLVTCMRQNPIWILLSEVRSAEAVLAVRNSISSGHHILSTIHADKASSIPMRMYSLLESSQEIDQFLSSIHRYVQIGVYVKGYFSKELNRFQREIIEVCEFYVDDDNVAKTNTIYKKTMDGKITLNNPTSHLIDYLNIGNVFLPEDVFHLNDGTRTDVNNNSENSNTNAFDNVLNTPEMVSTPTLEPASNDNGVSKDANAGAIALEPTPVQDGVVPTPVAPNVEMPTQAVTEMAAPEMVSTPTLEPASNDNGVSVEASAGAIALEPTPVQDGVVPIPGAPQVEMPEPVVMPKVAGPVNNEVGIETL